MKERFEQAFDHILETSEHGLQSMGVVATDVIVEFSYLDNISNLEERDTKLTLRVYLREQDLFKARLIL